MSLDVTLYGDTATEKCTCACCWNEHTREVREEFFSANITHNLSSMAEEAGIYQHLWRPEEIRISHADELIKPLEDGLELLKSDPEKFSAFNAMNGWGKYDDFVAFVTEYLQACKNHPEAKVEASR